jgi:hypothetical protein
MRVPRQAPTRSFHEGESVRYPVDPPRGLEGPAAHGTAVAELVAQVLVRIANEPQGRSVFDGRSANNFTKGLMGLPVITLRPPASNCGVVIALPRLGVRFVPSSSAIKSGNCGQRNGSQRPVSCRNSEPPISQMDHSRRRRPDRVVGQCRDRREPGRRLWLARYPKTRRLAIARGCNRRPYVRSSRSRRVIGC